MASRSCHLRRASAACLARDELWRGLDSSIDGQAVEWLWLFIPDLPLRVEDEEPLQILAQWYDSALSL